MSVAVRPLEARDRYALAAILERTENFASDEVVVALELIDEALLGPDATTYRVEVATREEDGEVLGYVCFGATPMTEHTYDLYWIVVDPAARGLGVGKRLWEACAERVRREGGRLVRIETSSMESYGATQAFYRRIDFSEVGRIADFYKAGDDLITYVKRV